MTLCAVMSVNVTGDGNCGAGAGGLGIVLPESYERPARAGAGDGVGVCCACSGSASQTIVAISSIGSTKRVMPMLTITVRYPIVIVRTAFCASLGDRLIAFQIQLTQKESVRKGVSGLYSKVSVHKSSAPPLRRQIANCESSWAQLISTFWLCTLAGVRRSGKCGSRAASLIPFPTASC